MTPGGDRPKQVMRVSRLLRFCCSRSIDVLPPTSPAICDARPQSCRLVLRKSRATLEGSSRLPEHPRTWEVQEQDRRCRNTCLVWYDQSNQAGQAVLKDESVGAKRTGGEALTVVGELGKMVRREMGRIGRAGGTDGWECQSAIGISWT